MSNRVKKDLRTLHLGPRIRKKKIKKDNKEVGSAHNLLLDKSKLVDFIVKSSRCNHCNGKFTKDCITIKRKGIASEVNWKCTCCGNCGTIDSISENDTKDRPSNRSLLSQCDISTWIQLSGGGEATAATISASLGLAS